MNYESMSDHRINALVTSSAFDCEEWEYNDAELYHCGMDGSGYYSQPILDYCNNPADAWPIIIENKISVEYDHSEDCWIAHHGDYLMGRYVSECGYRCQCSDKNPLRAAMIVFLMMNGE